MKKYLLLVLAAVLSACSTEIVEPDMNGATSLSEEPVVVPTDGDVSDREAAEAAASFMGYTVSSRSAASRVLSVEDSNRTMAYVVNFHNESGFVMLSASKDCQPVLAYSDSGHFNIDEMYDCGVGSWFNEIKSVLSETNDDSVKIANRMKWKSLLCKPQNYQMSSRAYSSEIDMLKQQAEKYWYENGWTYVSAKYVYENLVHEYIPYGLKTDLINLVESGQICYISGRPAYEDSYIIYRNSSQTMGAMSPVISTSWGQGYPYNIMMLDKYPQNTNGALGCAAIAAGQIIKYHKSAPGYDYSSMPDVANWSNYSTVAKFLLDVGERIGINYAANQSGATVGQAKNAFESYGYKCSVKSVALSDVASYNLPTYMVGWEPNDTTGHAWVCDGYEKTMSKTEYNLMIPNENYNDAGNIPYVAYQYNTNGYTESAGGIVTYVHCNWGWNGSYNGYFLTPKPGNYNFTRSQYIIDLKR